MTLDETFVIVTRLESFQSLEATEKREIATEKKVRAVADRSDAVSNRVQQLENMLAAQSAELNQLRSETVALRRQTTERFTEFPVSYGAGAATYSEPTNVPMMSAVGGSSMAL